MGLSIRSAAEHDLDRIIEIHTCCYPDDRTAAQRRLNFVQNPWGRLEDLRVAEPDGRIVGHGFGFELQGWFGGVRVPMVGIASVGVAPEARGRGVGRAIVSGLEEGGRARGALIALLHPFRHGFYAALGYADVTPMRRLVVDPRAVPSAWASAARQAPLHAASAADLPSIQEAHEQAAQRALGWIDRPQSLWVRMLTSERLHFIVLERAGYIAFEVLQSEPHSKTVLLVRELVGRTPEAWRTLWGFLGTQAGQVSEVAIEVADDDPIFFALTDVDGTRHGDARVEHDLGVVVAGPMIKMLDAVAALRVRGFTKNAAVRADPRTLTSIAFGGLAPRDAARLGLLDADDADLAEMDATLHGPPFHTLDRF